jgi:hypothetical protein
LNSIPYADEPHLNPGQTHEIGTAQSGDLIG